MKFEKNYYHYYEDLSEGRLHTGSDVLPSFFDFQTLISRFDITIH